MAGRSLYLGNLPYETTRQDINQLLRDFAVREIKLPMDESSRRNKGHAFIEFEHVSDVEPAKAHAEKITLQGRKLKVDYSDGGKQNNQKHRSFSDSMIPSASSASSSSSHSAFFNSVEEAEEEMFPGGPSKSPIKPPPFPSKHRLSLAQHKSWNVGDKCDARYSADSVWYAAVIDEVVESSEGKHKYVVTYTLFGNSEELAYEDLRAPSVGSEPPPSRLLQPETPSHTFHQPQQQQQQQQVIHSAVSTPSKTLDTFLVGDICEGHFTEDDTWYMCEIQEVLDNGARFKVIYTDYGNSEIIPASRVRAPGFSGVFDQSEAPTKAADLATSTTTNSSVSVGSSYNLQNKWQIEDKCQALLNNTWVNVTIDDATIKGNWFVVIPDGTGESSLAMFESLRAIPKIYKNWKVGDLCFGESGTDGKVREGIVVKVFTNSCMVTFPDVARVETLPFEKLKPTTEVEDPEPQPLPSFQPQSSFQQSHLLSTSAAKPHGATAVSASPSPSPSVSSASVTATAQSYFRDSPIQASPHRETNGFHDASPPVTRGLGLETVQTPTTPSLTPVGRKLFVGAATEKFKQLDLSNITPYVPKGK